MLSYKSIKEICYAAEKEGKTISEVILKDQAEQMEQTPEELFNRMDNSLSVMIEAVKKGKNPDLRSSSGLSGGDAAKIESYSQNGGICGKFMCGIITRAIAVSEYNAAMGKIVAAPTAGSCGILPAAIISMLDEGLCDRHQAVMALFTAGGIGMVIAQNASIAGAEGGCQAECGSAAAMAAASIVELAGGTPSQCAHALAMSIKNQLGLVCDPVAGLVEVPCIKRNVSGVMIAFSSAEMALAGVESKIPADECIVAMKQVGSSIPCSLRETSQGGLAATPTGINLKNQIFS